MRGTEFRQQKTWVTIVTCQPSKKLIEVKMDDGGLTQVAVRDIHSAFRWPKSNEVWGIHRDPIDGQWLLGNRVPGFVPKEVDGKVQISEQEDFDIVKMSEGDLRLDSDQIYDGSGRQIGATPVVTAFPENPYLGMIILRSDLSPRLVYMYTGDGATSGWTPLNL